MRWKIDLRNILNYTVPKFYELFLDNGNGNLIDIPIKIQNLFYQNSYPN